MNTADVNIKIQSFGRYLQVIRKENGISLETVSRETKIRKDVLNHIEREDFEHLPDPAFMRGFLRAYAESIGASSEETLKRYDHRLMVNYNLEKSEAALSKSLKRFWSRLAFSVTALCVLILLSVFTHSRLENHRNPAARPASGNAAGEVKKIESKQIAGPIASTFEDENQESQKPEKYLLQIQAVEETWMKITVDERKPNEYTLNPGDYMELEALTGFNLIIGNAGGVRMKLNQEPLKIPWFSGEVVNLTIP